MSHLIKRLALTTAVLALALPASAQAAPLQTCGHYEVGASTTWTVQADAVTTSCQLARDAYGRFQREGQPWTIRAYSEKRLRSFALRLKRKTERRKSMTYDYEGRAGQATLRVRFTAR